MASGYSTGNLHQHGSRQQVCCLCCHRRLEGCLWIAWGTLDVCGLDLPPGSMFMWVACAATWSHDDFFGPCSHKEECWNLWYCLSWYCVDVCGLVTTKDQRNIPGLCCYLKPYWCPWEVMQSGAELMSMAHAAPKALLVSLGCAAAAAAEGQEDIHAMDRAILMSVVWTVIEDSVKVCGSCCLLRPWGRLWS